MRERGRQRQTETERDRQTDRNREIERERQTDRNRDTKQTQHSGNCETKYPLLVFPKHRNLLALIGRKINPIMPDMTEANLSVEKTMISFFLLCLEIDVQYLLSGDISDNFHSHLHTHSRLSPHPPTHPPPTRVGVALRTLNLVITIEITVIFIAS